MDIVSCSQSQGEHLYFLSMEYDSGSGFIICVLYCVWVYSLISTLLKAFIINWCWILSKAFSASIYTIIWYLKKIYCYSITVVCLFSTSLHPTRAEPISHPHLHPPPWFCPYVLYSSSCNPLFPLAPPNSPLAIVRLSLISMSLVIFCLLFFFYWLCSS